METSNVLDNRGWQTELRNTTGEHAAVLKDCRLPSKSEIEIEGDHRLVTLTLKRGIHANMQTDAAAFEAWALALLCHCGVEQVCIALGADESLQVGSRHYQRFLYRLERFIELLPGRVYAPPELRGRALALDNTLHRVLNQPSEKRETAVWSEALFTGLSAGKSPSEAALEKAIEVSPAFRKTLCLNKLMRQWPVGLFRERVASSNYIFTGGKSAIDLIGTSEDALVLIELKRAGNAKVGALSELLFYSSLMRDTIRGDFKFEGHSQPPDNCITGADVLRCQKIQPLILAPRIHPLLRDGRIVAELNKAASATWKDIPVEFSMMQFDHSAGEDFTFQRLVRPGLPNVFGETLDQLPAT